MPDLLDANAIADFKNAMRDVADTFNRYQVTLQQSGGDTPLLAGKAPLKSDSNPDALRLAQEGEEIEEGFLIKFNRSYLLEQGLIDGNGALLISYDDRVLIDGNRYAISLIDSVGTFRNEDLNVVLKVVR